MALPPIITNSPIFKIFSGTPASRSAENTRTVQDDATLPRDTVSLSDAALKKLEDATPLAIRSESAARETATTVRVALESSPDLALGYEGEA